MNETIGNQGNTVDISFYKNGKHVASGKTKERGNQDDRVVTAAMLGLCEWDYDEIRLDGDRAIIRRLMPGYSEPQTWPDSTGNVWYSISKMKG